MKISIHIHSEYSMDAKQSVSSILELCRYLGFDAIAITDHNTTAGSLAAAGLNPPDMKIITGAEFSTDKGHILALFINDEIEKYCRKLGNVYDFEDLVLRVRHQGGFLFLAHPLESKASEDPSFIARLDGYERINGRINSCHKNKKANRLSAVLKAAYPEKIQIGGSDAHTNPEIKSVYMTSDALDLKEAILSADTICFKKSSVTKIKWDKLKNHRNKSVKYYVKQTAALLFGLLYDAGNKIKGASYEIIRVRKES